jgi:6-phosphogluconolactonase
VRVSLRIEVLDDDAAVAERTAVVIAEAAREARQRLGRAVLAFSGGSTPAPMLQRLGGMDVKWNATHVLQVDERVAPDGHDDRNWTMLTSSLLETADIPEPLLHPMPVTASSDGGTTTLSGEELTAAAHGYGQRLTTVAGVPPTIDVVHLGIGDDGHTASLVPGDPVLGVTDRWVAVAGPYQGRLRMTFTYPTINAAGLIVWQVTDRSKATALRAGLQGSGVPASQVRRRDVVAVVTADAAAELDGR